MSSFSTHAGSTGVSSTTSSQDAQISHQIFTSSLPLAISLCAAELPSSSSDITLANEYVYYVIVRRNSYLPMILRQVREHLLDLVSGGGGDIKDDELWFEFKGVPLKWHWPIGLLYDFTTSNLAPTVHRPRGSHVGPSRSAGATASPSTTTTPQLPSTECFSAGITSPSFLPPPRSPLMSQSTTTTTNTNTSPSPSPPTPWPITLHIKNLPTAKLPPPTANPIPSAASSSSSSGDAIASCVESVKQAYMASLKEADFVRNGNTKKVTALRRSEQDGIWDAVQKGDYTSYHSLMGKILPPASSYNAAGDQTQQQQQGGQPSRPPSQPATEGAASTSNAPSTAPVPNRVSSLYSLSSGLGNSSSTSLTPSLNTLALTGGSSDDPPAHNADDSQNTPTSAATTTPGTLKGPGLPGLKTIPVRFILQGGTILQESIPPLVSTSASTGEDVTSSSSRHTTLALVLHTLFPALFPLSTTSKPSFSLGLDFSSSSSAGGHDPNDVTVDALAVPITQGIRIPLSTTMLWLNKCLSGADGWVTIVLFLLPIGDETQ